MTPRVTRSLVLSILAAVALGASSAWACDGNQSTKASAASASCPMKTASATCATPACPVKCAEPSCCAGMGATTAVKASATKRAPARAAKTTKSAKAPAKATASRPAAPAEAGMRAQLDPETGLIGAAPVIGQVLDDQLVERNVVLTEQPLAGGGYTLDLQGTLLDYYVLQIDARGGRHVGCAKDPRILFQRTPQPVATPAQPLE